MFGRIRKLVVVAAFPECAVKRFPYFFFSFPFVSLHIHSFTQMTLSPLEKQVVEL
jgi:hypothetical protein